MTGGYGLFEVSIDKVSMLEGRTQVGSGECRTGSTVANVETKLKAADDIRRKVLIRVAGQKPLPSCRVQWGGVRWAALIAGAGGWTMGRFGVLSVCTRVHRDRGRRNCGRSGGAGRG